MAIYISDNVDYRKKKIIRDKETYYVMIKWKYHQQDIKTQMCKQHPVELKEEINKFTLIAGDVNSSLWVTDRNTRQKISKIYKNWTIWSASLTGTYKTLHPTIAESPIFKAPIEY